MRLRLFKQSKSYKLRTKAKSVGDKVMSLALVALMFSALAYPAVATNHASAYAFPSTNANNKTLNRPYVELLSSAIGQVSLRFINNTNSQAFFEVRKDGVQTGTTAHPVVTGDTIHSGGVSVDNRTTANPKKSSVDQTIMATTKVEVRLALGGERNWDFDWTTFNTIPVPVAPTNLRITNPNLACGSYTNSASITANWDAAPNASSYNYRVWTNAPGSSYNSQATAYIASGLTGTSRPGDFTEGEGTYFFELQSVVAGGFTSAWSVTCGITYDKTAPVVTVTPVAGSILYGTVNFNITVTDVNVNTLTNKKIYVYLYNSTGTQKSKGANVDLSSGQGTFTVDTTQLDDGKAWLDVGRLLDAAGNPSGTNDTYFKDYIIDNTGPSGLVHLTPADDAHSTTANAQQITWSTATDANGPVTYNYESSYSDQTNATGGFASPIYGPVSVGTSTFINTPNTPEGVYYYHVQAVDSLGNKTAWTTARKITIDNTKPTVAFTAPASFATPFAVGPTVQTTATDNGKIKTYVIHVYKGGTNTIVKSCTATAAQLTSGDLSCDLSALAEGTYYIKAGATDRAGNNRTILSGDFQIDTTAPTTPTLTAPANNSSIATSSFNFDWTDATDTNAITYVWESSYGTAVTADGGFSAVLASHSNLATSEVASPGTPDNTYYWHVRAVDAAGNKGAWTTAFKVTVDTVAPEAPIATPPAGFYLFAKSIELSSSDAAAIYYTTDDSTPSTTNGTLYTGAFNVLTTKTVKAIAYDTAGNASPVLVAPYIVIIPIVVPPIVLPGVTLAAVTSPAARTAAVPQPAAPTPVTTAATLGTSSTTNTGEVKAATTDNTAKEEPAKTGSTTAADFWPLTIPSLAALFFLIARRRSGE